MSAGADAHKITGYISLRLEPFGEQLLVINTRLRFVQTLAYLPCQFTCANA